jgi:hypothetical protein
MPATSASTASTVPLPEKLTFSSDNMLHNPGHADH